MHRVKSIKQVWVKKKKKEREKGLGNVHSCTRLLVQDNTRKKCFLRCHAGQKKVKPDTTLPGT